MEGVHARWTELWRSLAPSQFARVFHHPEIGVVTLDAQLQMHAWHSRHHVAHITSLENAKGGLSDAVRLKPDTTEQSNPLVSADPWHGPPKPDAYVQKLARFCTSASEGW